MLEESYYTIDGRTHASPHLFLFTEEGEAVKLTSYQLPKGPDGGAVTYETLPPMRVGGPGALRTIHRRPVYAARRRVGGRQRQHVLPVLKFTLYDAFSQEALEVTETMEMNGKRTFGYDVPIVYRRTETAGD